MNEKVAKIISKLILPERTVRIKLLGDSITHGEGGTGFCQNGEPIVENFRRNRDGYCWAKLFCEYMEAQYDCRVVNNACTGTNTHFILRNFDALVDSDDDIVICVIGTNNRHQSFTDGPRRTRAEHARLFYDSVLRLHERFVDAGKDVIFVANIPAAAHKETDGESWWRILHMNDIRDLYMKASVERGFALVDLYTAFLRDCEARGVTVDSLLKDGLHPNDAGYDVMFRLMLDGLGLARKVEGAEY